LHVKAKIGPETFLGPIIRRVFPEKRRKSLIDKT